MGRVHRKNLMWERALPAMGPLRALHMLNPATPGTPPSRVEPAPTGISGGHGARVRRKSHVGSLAGRGRRCAANPMWERALPAMGPLRALHMLNPATPGTPPSRVEPAPTGISGGHGERVHRKNLMWERALPAMEPLRALHMLNPATPGTPPLRVEPAPTGISGGQGERVRRKSHVGSLAGRERGYAANFMWERALPAMGPLRALHMLNPATPGTPPSRVEPAPTRVRRALGSIRRHGTS